MMLAIYLAAPEVENDRSALNTFYGMRRARKEGRLMGKAPFGYINRSKEDGRKYVALKEPQASAMRWAFNEIAKGVFAADQVRQKMNTQSPTKLSRSAFHVAIRNPLYYGKIFIAKFQDEEAHLVQGRHEPLISEELFNKVQRILDGNKRMERPNTKILSDKNLPLRGFLTCPKCGRNLTGSASKGRTNRYYYYHCIASCGFREQAGNANAIFENGLLQFELNDGIKNILKKLLLDNYKKFVQSPMNEKKKVSEEIDRLNARLSVARNKLLSETIDDEEYLDIKRECKEKIERLEEQLSKEGLNAKKVNIDKSLDRALQSIVNIPKLYREGGISTKRAVIGSIFPEKLEFDGKTYRTARMNVIANYIFQINNGLLQKRNRTNENEFHLSCLVARPEVEPGGWSGIFIAGVPDDVSQTHTDQHAETRAPGSVAMPPEGHRFQVRVVQLHQIAPVQVSIVGAYFGRGKQDGGIIDGMQVSG
jgi:site-specific DNA recombinase